MGNNTNSAPYKAGLRGRDIVTAVNGQTTNLNGRAFLVWFRQQFDRGDEVTLGVRDRNGAARNVTYKLSGADN